MALVGMAEAARRLGVHQNSVRRTLLDLGVPLVTIHARALAVEEVDLERAAIERAARGIAGKGRPRKAAPTTMQALPPALKESSAVTPSSGEPRGRE